MAIMYCPECGRGINEPSNYCPSCGFPIANLQTINQPPEKTEQGGSTDNAFRTFLVVTCLLIVGVIAYIAIAAVSGRPSSYGSGKYYSAESYNTKDDAKVCAEDAVKQVLNSPSTAKFCPAYEMTATNTGGAYWKVTGYVDAQNGFGTYVRKNWTVTLELTEEGYRHGKVTFDD